MAYPYLSTSFEVVATCPREMVEEAGYALSSGYVDDDLLDRVATWFTSTLHLPVSDIEDYHPVASTGVEGNFPFDTDIHTHKNKTATLCIWPDTEGHPNMHTIIYNGILHSEGGEEWGGHPASNYVEISNGLFVPKPQFAGRLSLRQANNGELVSFTGPHSSTPFIEGLPRLMTAATYPSTKKPPCGGSLVT